MIFREKRLINWDIKLQTAVSDLEVENKNVNGYLYFVKYPLKKNKDSFITIATTRPETMLGDTGVAVNPKDERYKKFIGKKIIVPIVDREVKIILEKE